MPSWMTKSTNLLLYKHLNILLWWRPLGGYTGQPIDIGIGECCRHSADAQGKASLNGEEGRLRKQVFSGNPMLWSRWTSMGEVQGSFGVYPWFSSLDAVTLPTIPSPDGKCQKLSADCQHWPGVLLMESLGGTCL